MSDHISEPAQRPMIVTAWIEPDDLAIFNRLRQRLFPAHLNKLTAHLTLFHHIPAAERQSFIRAAKSYAAAEAPMQAEVLAPFPLGRGVAYQIDCQALNKLRSQLRNDYLAHLTPQDSVAKKRLHITVQNKVSGAEAKRTLDGLLSTHESRELGIRGLQFYRYDGGPWTWLDACTFGDGRR